MAADRGIALGCFFIGLAFLGQTAYTAYHDHAVAAAEQRQRELIARTTAEAAKLAKGKAAWMRATRDLGVHMRIYLYRTNAETTQVETSVKAYSHSDIIWRDSRKVTVQGYVITVPSTLPKAPKGDLRQYYSWSRDLVLLDDDSWGTMYPAFTGVNPSKVERDSMFTVEIK